MRNSENQAVQEDPRGTTEHVTTATPHSELSRRPGHSTELPHTELTGLSGQAPYTLNFSFEELNTIGLDEAPPRHSNLSWQVLTEKCFLLAYLYGKGFFPFSDTQRSRNKSTVTVQVLSVFSPGKDQFCRDANSDHALLSQSLCLRHLKTVHLFE